MTGTTKKTVKKKTARAPEQRFRSIFEHSPAMVYFTNLDGVILDINEAGVKMLGYKSREEIEGLVHARSVYEDPTDRGRFLKSMEKTGSVQDFETRFRRLDGTVMDVMITAAMRRDRKGDVEGYEGFVIDVTDRKRAGRALHDSEEKYRTVVENSLSGIFVHQGGLFQFVNQRFAEMLGYDHPDEFIGMPFWEVVHPEDRAMVKGRGLRREKAQIDPTQYPFRAIKKNGSTIWVELRATHAAYMGEPAVVGNFIDITQSKKAEEEIRHLSRRLIEVSEEEKKKLARDLHDEFGQTLTSLHFDLEAVHRNIPTEFTDQRKRFGGIIQTVERLADSVRKTTSYLRPDLLDHLGLIPTLEWYIQEFTGRWPDVQVDFQTLGFKKRLNPEIEMVLYRIFQEGLTNISKHAKASRIEIMLTYSHPRAIFVIRDNGVGYKHIRKGSASGKNLRGIGLLSMRERVASFGGSIDIISTPGKGTTIRVDIPVT